MTLPAGGNANEFGLGGLNSTQGPRVVKPGTDGSPLAVDVGQGGGHHSRKYICNHMLCLETCAKELAVFPGELPNLPSSKRYDLRLFRILRI